MLTTLFKVINDASSNFCLEFVACFALIFMVLYNSTGMIFRTKDTVYPCLLNMKNTFFINCGHLALIVSMI